jgi:hypothetical protein
MIRTVVAVAAGALLAASCGAAGGGKAALVQKCVKEDGQSEKICQCMADKMEKSVDKDVFRAMIMEAEGKTEEAQKLLQSLPMEKQMSVMGAFSAFECLGQS